MTVNQNRIGANRKGMKRLFPLILALLLCVGCGKEPAVEPGEPRLEELTQYLNFGG